MPSSPSLDELEDHEAPSSDDREEHAARRDLGVLLRSISPAQREAIVLTKIEGLTVAEVSCAPARAWRR